MNGVANIFVEAGIRFTPAIPVTMLAAQHRQMPDFPPLRAKSSWNPYTVIL
jgi:hypothetical protein